MAETDDGGGNRGRKAWWLVAAPIVFLAHFSAVYGFNALACSFGWATRELMGWPMVPVLVLAFTGVVVAVLLLAMPAGPRAAAEDDDDDDRDEGAPRVEDREAERRFSIGAVRLVCVLAAFGMLMVAVPALVTRPC